ncbi:hypothetical protein [Salipiger abyssi]|uniref:Uncharacterized protein n=1 Tax=Salipiger abyssi TaxID=1250539 RepID=A0A1P8UXN6_9RHOB|nr:hypothetical protein [Salipiger abyssi]ALF02136.1 hypothetical protein vBPeaSP1_045 [Pelagibaca phage vB_PeaS-P1]APZ54151.1 hypothetical protein Ga0080574_TMP3817 [Salipiger abyssi]
MLTCHADVIQRAREVGQMLPDEQRVALGVTLICMARQPESFGAVQRAGRMVSDHANALTAEALHAGADEAPFLDMTIDTTHGPVFDRHPGGRGTAGAPRPRLSSSLRAAWATLRAAERRFSEGVWGDLLAGICAVIGMIGLSFIAWGLS